MSILRRCAIALFIVVISAGNFAQAQSAGRANAGTAKIDGQVSDSQLLPMPQATIELQDGQGNTLQKIAGDATGHYQFDSVAAGTYTLAFSRAGFETLKKPVTLADAQSAIVDATLQPEKVAQTVTVLGTEDTRQVGSKIDVPAEMLPVTVDSVPLEMIQQQDSSSVIPVINNLPGANAWTQYGSLNYFSFRGFAEDHDPGSAVLLNGLRVEGNRSDSLVNSVQSVDVLKGPGSMLYGTEDTGGTINIVQKQPLNEPHYEVVLHGSRWETAGVEFGATGPLTSDKLLYRLDTAYMHSNGFREAGSKRFNLSPKLYWRISPRDQLHVNLTYDRDNFHGDVGIPLLPVGDGTTFVFPNVNLNNRYNSPNNFEYLNSPILQAFYQHQFSDNLTLREAAQLQTIGDQYWQSEGVFIDPTTDPLLVFRGPDDFSVYFNHHDRSVLSQTVLLGAFHFLGNHQWLVGYEYDYLFHRTKRSSEAQNTPIPPIDLFNPVETAAPITKFPASRYDGLRNLSNAISFQDYFNIHPKLQLLVGGRYDAYQHYDFRYPVVGGVEVKGPHQNVFSQDPFTYRVGINSQLLPFLGLYTSYSTSFTAQTGLSDAGNPLKPEHGSQFEAGARLNAFQNRVTLNVAWYHIIQQNIAVELADGVIVQAGQQYSKGVEVTLRARPTQRVNIYAAYGFTQTAFDDFDTFDFFTGDPVNIRGNVPGLVPKHNARIWTNYDLPKGFGVSLGWRYASSRATDIYNFYWMGGFSTFEAAFRYQRGKVDYSLNLSNVLNKTHYLISAIDDTQVYPGPPINVSATIRYRFK